MSQEKRNTCNAPTRFWKGENHPEPKLTDFRSDFALRPPWTRNLRDTHRDKRDGRSRMEMFTQFGGTPKRRREGTDSSEFSSTTFPSNYLACKVFLTPPPNMNNLTVEMSRTWQSRGFRSWYLSYREYKSAMARHRKRERKPLMSEANTTTSVIIQSSFLPWKVFAGSICEAQNGVERNRRE
ncbi:hypothetical protein BDM02DRAFT_1927257 [Thelephora ganbajun]|uniref:Uncharacterized protein n=1 Tax=Thelephora ganbajun TaxID=370292 RepID=A0ACB6ZHH6_THEGA|nr:hypothetical protein BDM02DRAFT_1927257 [Thelephora ganbajun]